MPLTYEQYLKRANAEIRSAKKSASGQVNNFDDRVFVQCAAGIVAALSGVCVALSKLIDDDANKNQGCMKCLKPK